ncbi:hypothetical protein SPHV1_670017 [Novosphingobium sp. KN65.2]|nr:hypothetical protein SPHV1_670017 [Novosphingobium sp. KN65.2]
MRRKSLHQIFPTGRSGSTRPTAMDQQNRLAFASSHVMGLDPIDSFSKSPDDGNDNVMMFDFVICAHGITIFMIAQRGMRSLGLPHPI